MVHQLFLQVYYSPTLFQAEKTNKTLHHCLGFVQACWLSGGGDRWHHNNSSPSHLSLSRLTRNGSSPLRYDPLTPIRPWQGGRSASPALGACLSPSRHWGCRCWQLSRQMWKTPHFQWITAVDEKREQIWMGKKNQKKSVNLDFHRKIVFTSNVQWANVNMSKTSHYYCCCRWQGGSVWGLFPLRVYLQEEDFLEWKKKSCRVEGMSEISLGETDGITVQWNPKTPVM